MRLKINNLEVEGKSLKEINALVEVARSLVNEFKSNSSTEGGVRGKREKYIRFPQGKFTVQDLAEDLDISAACVYQRLKAMEVNGDAKIVGETRQQGQRGRGTKYWQVINFPVEPTGEEVISRKEKFDLNLDEVPE